jgi:acrylyl-CoA reductase (NADPH)
MSAQTFKAVAVEEVGEKNFVRTIKDRSVDDLPDGEVLIRVHYSSLNYKDALSSIGNKGVTKNYPHTPGVDASGVVQESTHSGFSAGDQVIVTGYDLGANTSGGFGEYIRVPADWVLKLPPGLTLKDSMVYGTAGFTAALSVMGLEKNGVTPASGEILVTGATGGVGSVAVGILSQTGYEVVAATGKKDQTQFLSDLGAKEVIGRDEVIDESGRALLKGRWAGVVDTVGGDILATAIKSTRQEGTVTCCGNAASGDLPLNVYPFILRAVTLIGIDSSNCPMKRRTEAWDRLSRDWNLDNLDLIGREVTLEELDKEIPLILEGKQVGRVVVNLT